jgi:hypothetical protein
LSVVKIDRVPVHGGSIRIYAGLPEIVTNLSEGVMAIIEAEQLLGLNDLTCYENFAKDVQKNRLVLINLLESLRKEGKTIAGYGAPAKGNTLLNYCSIDDELVKFTVDKNPLKVGLFTPGMHIPILPVETLLEQMPDYVLILAWNFADEIMRQEQEYRQKGGRFIIPISEAVVV